MSMIINCSNIQISSTNHEQMLNKGLYGLTFIDMKVYPWYDSIVIRIIRFKKCVVTQIVLKGCKLMVYEVRLSTSYF